MGNRTAVRRGEPLEGSLQWAQKRGQIFLFEVGVVIGVERNTSGSTIGIDPDGGKGILYDNRRKEKQALAACGRACFGYDD